VSSQFGQENLVTMWLELDPFRPVANGGYRESDRAASAVARRALRQCRY